MIEIECIACDKVVSPRLVQGKQIYPHRKDLWNIKLWKCEDCNNYVATHKGTLTPLGIIPTPRIRKERGGVHLILDPIWQSKKVSRNNVYKYLSRELGYEYHTGNIKTVAEAGYIKQLLMKRYYK